MAKTKETSQKDPLEASSTEEKEYRKTELSSTYNDLKIELLPSSRGRKFKWKKDDR
jgi:hypothetical protein